MSDSPADRISELVRVYIAERLAPTDQLHDDVSLEYHARNGEYVEWETVKEDAVECAIKYAESLVDELYEMNEDHP